MSITAAQLASGMPRCPNPDYWAAAINAAQVQWGIQDGLELAHFLGQMAVETGQLTTLEENLNYGRQALANTWPNRYSSGRGSDGKQIPNDLAVKIERQPELIANYTYANRYGNGDVDSGDGWRFRGRGCKQLTFRDNYASFAAASGIDAENNPDLLLSPPAAIASGAWYWTTKPGLQTAARRDDVTEVTRLVNGGSIGLADRKAFTSTFKRVLGV